MSTETEVIKKFIEERYKRLEEGKRRPSCEYITVQEIREIFAGVVDDPEAFLDKPDEEIKQFYGKWYEETTAKLAEPEELDLPKIE